MERVEVRRVRRVGSLSGVVVAWSAVVVVDCVDNNLLLLLHNIGVVVRVKACAAVAIVTTDTSDFMVLDCMMYVVCYNI